MLSSWFLGARINERALIRNGLSDLGTLEARLVGPWGVILLAILAFGLEVNEVVDLLVLDRGTREFFQGLALPFRIVLLKSG